MMKRGEFRYGLPVDGIIRTSESELEPVHNIFANGRRGAA
jgi:hypothetical protein